VDQDATAMQSEIWWTDTRVSESRHSLRLRGTTGVRDKAAGQIVENQWLISVKE